MHISSTFLATLLCAALCTTSVCAWSWPWSAGITWKPVALSDGRKPIAGFPAILQFCFKSKTRVFLRPHKSSDRWQRLNTTITWKGDRCWSAKFPISNTLQTGDYDLKVTVSRRFWFDRTLRYPNVIRIWHICDAKDDLSIKERAHWYNVNPDAFECLWSDLVAAEQSRQRQRKIDTESTRRNRVLDTVDNSESRSDLNDDNQNWVLPDTFADSRRPLAKLATDKEVTLSPSVVAEILEAFKSGDNHRLRLALQDPPSKHYAQTLAALSKYVAPRTIAASVIYTEWMSLIKSAKKEATIAAKFDANVMLTSLLDRLRAGGKERHDAAVLAMKQGLMHRSSLSFFVALFESLRSLDEIKTVLIDSGVRGEPLATEMWRPVHDAWQAGFESNDVALLFANEHTMWQFLGIHLSDQNGAGAVEMIKLAHGKSDWQMCWWILQHAPSSALESIQRLIVTEKLTDLFDLWRRRVLQLLPDVSHCSSLLDAHVALGDSQYYYDDIEAILPHTISSGDTKILDHLERMDVENIPDFHLDNWNRITRDAVESASNSQGNVRLSEVLSRFVVKTDTNLTTISTSGDESQMDNSPKARLEKKYTEIQQQLLQHDRIVRRRFCAIISTSGSAERNKRLEALRELPVRLQSDISDFVGVLDEMRQNRLALIDVDFMLPFCPVLVAQVIDPAATIDIHALRPSRNAIASVLLKYAAAHRDEPALDQFMALFEGPSKNEAGLFAVRHLRTYPFVLGWIMVKLMERHSKTYDEIHPLFAAMTAKTREIVVGSLIFTRYERESDLYNLRNGLVHRMVEELTKDDDFKRFETLEFIGRALVREWKNALVWNHVEPTFKMIRTVTERMKTQSTWTTHFGHTYHCFAWENFQYRHCEGFAELRGQFLGDVQEDWERFKHNHLDFFALQDPQ